MGCGMHSWAGSGVCGAEGKVGAIGGKTIDLVVQRLPRVLDQCCGF